MPQKMSKQISPWNNYIWKIVNGNVSFATFVFVFRIQNIIMIFIFFAFSCIDIETSTSLLLYFERVKLLCIKFWGILLHGCSISECNVVMMRIWRSVSLAKLINMALPWHQHLANISFDNGYERLREHIQKNKTLCRTKN